MEKKRKIECIIYKVGIFYPYLIKKIYECAFKEKVSRQLINHCLKELLEKKELEKVGKMEFEGKYTWGNKTKRVIYISLAKGNCEANIRKECVLRYLNEFLIELEKISKKDSKALILKSVLEKKVREMLDNL